MAREESGITGRAYSRWKCIAVRFILGAMKTAFLLALVSLSLGSMQAADTAYNALRVVGKRDGQEILNHVIELHGHGGSPQPGVWKLVIDDAHARGGIRELEIERGKIVSERTPTAHGAESPMNFNQLNLDSEGAFTIADQEAQKANVPFSTVDYSLRAGSGAGVPVWELELWDGKNGRVGLVDIAADSGTVLRKDFDPRHFSQDDHAYLDDHQGPPPPLPPPPAYSGEATYTQGSLPDIFQKWGRKISRHFEKRGRQLENFISGKPVDESNH